MIFSFFLNPTEAILECGSIPLIFMSLLFAALCSYNEGHLYYYVIYSYSVDPGRQSRTWRLEDLPKKVNGVRILRSTRKEGSLTRRIVFRIKRKFQFPLTFFDN